MVGDLKTPAISGPSHLATPAITDLPLPEILKSNDLLETSPTATLRVSVPILAIFVFTVMLVSYVT